MNPYLTYKEILHIVDAIDPVAYTKTRNHLSGAVTRLSPYITRGVIALPDIRDRVVARHGAAAAEKLIQELAWREYWQQVWFARGEDIFQDLRFPRDDFKHTDLITTIIAGKSGIKAIDEEIAQLYETGYMHNHGRMWVAMLACNVGKAHWYDMSRWLYYHLLDGDLASNMLSWQWVAGTNASKRYVANQAVINGCSDIKELRTYLTMPREDVGVGEVPDILKATTPFSYTMQYPVSDVYNNTSPTIFLYSPWTLDPNWRKDESGERVLFIEPRWFDRFPVSPTVLDFIIAVAKTQVPDINVVVADVADLKFSSRSQIYSRAYPTHLDWPGEVDAMPRLFPQVTGYHPSFFKFWEACQKSIR